MAILKGFLLSLAVINAKIDKNKIQNCTQLDIKEQIDGCFTCPPTFEEKCTIIEQKSVCSCRAPFDYNTKTPMKFAENCSFADISANVQGCTYCKFKKLEKCKFDDAVGKNLCRCNNSCENQDENKEKDESKNVPKICEVIKKGKIEESGIPFSHVFIISIILVLASFLIWVFYKCCKSQIDELSDFNAGARVPGEQV